MTVTKLLCFTLLMALANGFTIIDSPSEDVESGSSYQRSILHDMAAPVTDNSQDHKVIDRERRETDIDVVDSSLRSVNGSRIRVIDIIYAKDTLGRQQLEPCEVHPANNMYDFNCGCNQQLGSERPIGILVLNHTECKTGLWVVWSELESSLRPQSIIFVGVDMTLTNQTVDEGFNSTVKNLTFINSDLLDLPMDAFKGLKALEELRFDKCQLKNVLEHAVRNHNKLKTIEIIQSGVGEIKQNAFFNLPAIEEFAITRSTLTDIKALGIHLNKNNGTDKSTSCLSRSSINSAMNDVVMGRQIQSANDINLPEFGTRFLLYKNNIQSIHTNAVNSNSFGFLILGGNYISKIESEAFNMQLHNPCEISAALFASNNITTLSNQSLVGISNKINSSSTFIALNNNIFDDVQVQGFQIEKGIKIFSVDGNKFECECKKLYWLLENKQSSNLYQTELKNQIASSANCTTGESLMAFKSSCKDLPTFKPKHHTTPLPDITMSTHTGETTNYSNTTPLPSSAVSHSNLVNVAVTASIFLLINLHRTQLY